jgi:uncharacterized CHY-type Zn-finger protein
MQIYFAYYFYSKLNKVKTFGGEYHCFANNVRDFIETLKHANIKPIFIIDGTCPQELMENRYQRFVKSNEEIKQLN